MVDQVKILLACSLITMPNLVVVSDTVLGGPKILGVLEPHSLWTGVIADP